jgi:hypothetical protein
VDQRPCSADKPQALHGEDRPSVRESDHLYQTKIEDLWEEIKSKAIVLGLSLIAFEVEIPLWVGCLVKASHLNEANELNELWERYKNDRYTYLPQLWAKFKDQCPLDYRRWEDSMTVRGWQEKQKQRELKQALQACPAISRALPAPAPLPNRPQPPSSASAAQQCDHFNRQAATMPSGSKGQRQLSCMYQVCVANNLGNQPSRLYTQQCSNP